MNNQPGNNQPGKHQPGNRQTGEHQESALAPAVRQKIEDLVSKNPVTLFMKGRPEAPQCGFSARVTQILDFLKIQYSSFDVLSDEEVRQGIKEYGQWPTIPQLYVKGELLGGCDIVQERFESGELEKELAPYQKTSD